MSGNSNPFASDFRSPSLPRSRAGARRKLQPRGANDEANNELPLILGNPRRPMSVGVTSPQHHPWDQPGFRQMDSREEEEEGQRMSSQLLQRIQGVGVKRTHVQAQMHAAEAFSSWGFIQDENPPSIERSCADRDDNKPLVSMTEQATPFLIPTRPAYTATTPNRRKTGFNGNVMPPSASSGSRTARHPPVSAHQPTEARVPLTARDRFYADQRAGTAPMSPMALRKQSTTSASSKPSSHPDGRTQARDSNMAAANSLRTNHDTAVQEPPKRSELFQQAQDIKTFSETVEERIVEENKRQAVESDMQPNETAMPRDSFFYLRRVDSNPYKLVPTEHSSMDPKDFYTMSRLGIAHFTPNSSEFTSLERFERENYIFTLVMKIPFFRKYRCWKQFHIWKHTLRWKKRTKASHYLKENLFMLLPFLHDALFELREQCVRLSRLRLFEFESQSGGGNGSAMAPTGKSNSTKAQTKTKSATSKGGSEIHIPIVTSSGTVVNLKLDQKTFTLSDFSSRLKAQKVDSERQVDVFLAKAQQIAKDACEHFLFAFLQRNGFNEQSAGLPTNESSSSDSKDLMPVQDTKANAEPAPTPASTADPDAASEQTEDQVKSTPLTSPKIIVKPAKTTPPVSLGSPDVRKSSVLKLDKPLKKSKKSVSTLPSFGKKPRILVATTMEEMKDEAEKRMTYTERATMRTQCRKVTKFLRVVEFLIADAFLMLGITSTEHLAHRMNEIRNAQRVNAGGIMSAVNAAFGLKHSPLFRIEVLPPTSALSSSNASSMAITMTTASSAGASSMFSGMIGSPRSSAANTANSRRQSTLLGLGGRGGAGGIPLSLVMEGGPVVTIGSTVDSIAFAPSSDTLRSQLESLVFAGLKVASNRERLLCHPMFQAYVVTSMEDTNGNGGDGDSGGGDKEIANETLDVDMLIMEDSTFQDTLTSIHRQIVDAFAQAAESTQLFLPFLRKSAENATFCKTSDRIDRFLDVSIEQLHELLKKYTAQIEEFDALPDLMDCGLLLVDSSRLNAFLKPSPRNCLEQLHDLIPAIAAHKNDLFMAEVTESNDRISAIPTCVDEYADTLNFWRELQNNLDEQDEKFLFLKNLYTLIDEFGIKISDLDQTNWFLLSQRRTQLRASMDLFENSREHYTERFAAELESRIPNLSRKLDQVAVELTYPKLFQLESSPNDMLQYLAKVDQKLNVIDEVVTKHAHFEKTLEIAHTQAFEPLAQMQEDLKYKTMLWQIFDQWQSKTLAWQNLAFPAEVDVPVIMTQILDYDAQILSIQPSLPSGMHLVWEFLKAKIDEYKHTMPIVKDLCCPAFEDRHFEEIHKLLGFSVQPSVLATAVAPEAPHASANSTNAISTLAPPVVDNAEDKGGLTLGTLVQMHLVPFGPQIARIATEATQEKRLKEMLDKIILIWERMEFELREYRDFKDLFIVVSVENVVSALEESLVMMNMLLVSKYLTPIKDQVHLWQKRLLLFQETLDCWVEVQRKWMYLESIFAAPDIQKQLPNETILFNGVHQFWKELMRRTRDQRNCMRASGALQATSSGPTGLLGLVSPALGSPATIMASALASGSTTNASSTAAAAASSAASSAASQRPTSLLLENLTKHNVSLDRIEKSLEDYLETKRGLFPRFYFISNDELLDILAHAKEPAAIQRHLCKIFDALVKLELGEEIHGGAQDILAMISPENERIAFSRSFKARGNIEDWLNLLLTNMRLTLQKLLKACLLDYDQSARENWLLRHPSQCVAIVSYIIWARECEVCFSAVTQDPLRELSIWHQMICNQVANLTRVVRATDLSRVQRNTVVSLITTDVHFRDVVEEFLTKRITKINDFLWQQQLRYYWQHENEECYVKQANCRIRFGYEYMGACTRLVITPLTDRCWMTITGALELKYGASPSGPAGTGKTETSKDLARALGILCIVFNCSEQIDYKMVGKMLSGVAQAGSWTCLDEFNRINIEVLSVVAQQMTALRHARLTKQVESFFEGRKITVKDHHVIITMNPGYLGRTELPDSLKASFRPVAMMVPDYALIAEIMLFSEGFQHAKILSRKVTRLYKLCSEQLSQQTHYDFGMRAVKTVLSMAGALRRVLPSNGLSGNSLSSSTSVSTSPGGYAAQQLLIEEDWILIKAMKDANFPKLLEEDLKLFVSIVQDLFPQASAIFNSSGTRDATAAVTRGEDASGGNLVANSPLEIIGLSPFPMYSILQQEIEKQIIAQHLQLVPKWQQRIVDMFDTMLFRTGVVQTGLSGSGKTTARHVLREAMGHLETNSKVHVSTLNPKSIPMAELYGFFNPLTREWIDGLASSMLRACIVARSEQLNGRLTKGSSSSNPFSEQAIGEEMGSITRRDDYFWVVFDGPIDVLWIESMNTVLDDNMTLCLANGERIKLLPRIHLVFEVSDTIYASPATISRLGVVHFHPKYLGWRPYVQTWLINLLSPRKLPVKIKERIYFYFDTCLQVIWDLFAGAKHSLRALQLSDIASVKSLCCIFESLLGSKVDVDKAFGLNEPSEEHDATTDKSCSKPGEGSSKSIRSPTEAPAGAAAESTKLSLEDQCRLLDLVFVFSVIWSFGGNFRVDQPTARAALNARVLYMVNHFDKFFAKNLLMVRLPGGFLQPMDDIYDVCIDFRDLNFVTWESFVRPFEYPVNLETPLFRLLVPTSELLKYTFVTRLLLIDSMRPVFITGESGCGKSVMVSNLLQALENPRGITTHSNASAPPAAGNTQAATAAGAAAATGGGGILPIKLHFSASTSSRTTQSSIESKFVRKRRTQLTPPINKKAVVFIEDIHMPSVERFGAQPPIELLRQFIEYKGFYDLDRFFWKDVEEFVVVVVGGFANTNHVTEGGGIIGQFMGTGSAQYMGISRRFLRQFDGIFCMPSCDESMIKSIFQPILTGFVVKLGLGQSVGSSISSAGSSTTTSSSTPATTANVTIKFIKEFLCQIVDAVWRLYDAVAKEFLPTPSKCHYLFNFRDIGNVMQSVMIGMRSCVAGNKQLSADFLSRLWVHESIRVFRDRLVDAADQKRFSELLVAIVNQQFELQWDLEVLYKEDKAAVVQEAPEENAGDRGSSTTPPPGGTNANHPPGTNVTATANIPAPFLFNCSSGPSVLSSGACGYQYEEIADFDAFVVLLEKTLQAYNASHGSNPLKLVFFKEAITHLVAISRVLIQPKSHLLLLGGGGSGKRSLARLGAFLNGCDVMEIELTKAYGANEFRDDLKRVMVQSVLGTQSGSGVVVPVQSVRPVVLLLSDNQMTSDSFLEDINTLLNGGEIPKLFNHEEHEKVLNDVRSMLTMTAASRSMPSAMAGSSGSATGTVSEDFANALDLRKACELFFAQRVQENMHFALCMSPHGEHFRARMRAFPCFVSCCTIDFFEPWPPNALESIAVRYLANMSMSSPLEQIVRTPRQLAQLCVQVHQTAGDVSRQFEKALTRVNAVTPCHYLEFLTLVGTITQEQKSQIDKTLTRLSSGVIKLEQTNETVGLLQQELIALQPVLAAKAVEVEQLLQQVALDQREASVVADRVARDEQKVKAQQQEVALCQADAQNDLDEALPALNAAVAALDSLDKKDITEVKAFIKPPQIVQMVMEAVCILLGEKPDWETSKRVLSKTSFMTDLKEYDKDNISPNTYKRIHKYIEHPEFAIDEVKKVSKAAMSLCMWVHAMDTYARVIREVTPKRQRLAEMNATLEDANRKLDEKQRELNAQMDKVQSLKLKCDQTVAERQRLMEEVALTKERLRRAEKLTHGLKDERVRWKESIERIQKQSESSFGDGFVCAAFMAYTGPFDLRFRRQFLEKSVALSLQMHLSVNESFSFVNVFGQEVVLREWQLKGLPSDEFSAQNAFCIVNKHRALQRWPLLIDPQEQASKWIKQMEAPHKLQVVKMNDKNLIEQVATSLRQARPLLIEEVHEYLEPCLDPLFLRAFHVTTNGRKVLKLSEREIPIHENSLRVYVTTKLSNPRFLPDVFIRLNVINFSVTFDGLEDQLLSDVLHHENPEVERKKLELLVSISEDQKLLSSIELKILELLTASKSNLLDDEELVHTLENSKSTSLTVTQRLEESEATKLEILTIRAQYQPVALHGAILFFAVSELQQMDPMYQFSLSFFSQLFNKSFDTAPVAMEIEMRLENLGKRLVEIVFRNICRGLFMQHRLVFALLITLRMLAAQQLISNEEIRLLLGPQSSVLQAGATGASGFLASLLDPSTLTSTSTATNTVGSVANLNAERPLLKRRSSTNATATSSSQSNLLDANAFGMVYQESYLALSRDPAMSIEELGRTTTVFAELIESYHKDPQRWQTWWERSANCFFEPTPYEFDSKLSQFQKLILVRWLREEFALEAIQWFVEDALQLRVMTAQEFAMEEIHNDMTSETPCVFLLCAGADPLQQVGDFARQRGFFDDKYHVISLGQGQGPVAEALMESGAKDGHWVVLHNIHLARNWLCQKFPNWFMNFRETARSEGDVLHKDFRLFMTCHAVSFFPQEILQACIKVTYEPPRGIRANLERCFQQLASSSTLTTTTNEASLLSSSDPAATPHGRPTKAGGGLDIWVTTSRRACLHQNLVLGLCFFHAILQERKQFGPLGWNIHYDFSDADLHTVVTVQKDLLDAMEQDNAMRPTNAIKDAGVTAGSSCSLVRRVSSREQQELVPWDALHFLAGEIHYGGRVTDEFDRRCLMANLRRFCSSRVIEQVDEFDPDPKLDPCPIISSLGEFLMPVFRQASDVDVFLDLLPSSASNASEIFGMNANGNLVCQKQQTQAFFQFCQTLFQQQPVGSSAQSGPTSASSTIQADASTPDASISSTAGAGTEPGSEPTTREAMVLQISKAIHQKLPKRLDAALLETFHTTMTIPSPDQEGGTQAATSDTTMNDPFVVVLGQEAARYNALLEYMTKSLDQVQQALQGTMTMTIEIEKTVTSLLDAQVPSNWLLKSFASLKPLASWLEDLRWRVRFFQDWLEKKGVHPLGFPLPVFFFPQGFLTVVLQRHSRKYLLPINQLEFSFEVVPAVTLRTLGATARRRSIDRTPSGISSLPIDRTTSASGNNSSSSSTEPAPTPLPASTSPPKLVRVPSRRDSMHSLDSDGVYVYGLFLENAQWSVEKKCLRDPKPGVLHSPMPVIHFLPQVVGAGGGGIGPLRASGSQRQLNFSGAAVGPLQSSGSKRHLNISGTTSAATASPLPSPSPPAGADGLPVLSQRKSVSNLRRSSSSFARNPLFASGKYLCPVYKTRSRRGTLSTTGTSTNFVLAIDLFGERAPDHYVLNGTALICNLDR